MRIALVAQSCDNITGVGRIVSSLGEEFAAGVHEVHIVAQRISAVPQGAEPHKVFGFSSMNGVNKALFRYITPGVIRSLNCDVVNAFGVGRTATVVTAQSCHRAGMELLKKFTRERIWESNFGLFDRISLDDEQALFTSPKTKQIIAVSQFVKEQIAALYRVDRDRITVIPNGVNLSAFADNAAQRIFLRAKYELTPEDFALLFIGNEFDRKGLQTIIEALNVLRGQKHRLFIVGRGNSVPYKALAERLGVTDRVMFLGETNAPERLLALADAFVLPSLYEPFGIVVIEAMAAGVPVVTSRLTGAVEGMTHAEHGLYLDDPTSARELAHAVEELTNDGSLRHRLIEKGKMEAEQFSWQRIAARTLEVYEQTSK